jgi:hypothetical protein
MKKIPNFETTKIKERNLIFNNGTHYNIEIFIIFKNNIISAKVDINLKAK